MDELTSEIKSFFKTYKIPVGEAIRSEAKVLFVSFGDVAEHSPKLAETLIDSPEDTIIKMEDSLEDLTLRGKIKIRFNEFHNTQQLKIREIRSRHLNKFLIFEGIVRQASEVRPQMVNARFECMSCGSVMSILQTEKKIIEPKRCGCGRTGKFKLIEKKLVDEQRLIIEECTEDLNGGEQPRRISVFLQSDLVEPHMEEKTTPGSKVRILGILKEVPLVAQGGVATRYDFAIEVNNIIPLESEFEDFEIDQEDEKQIKELAADPDLFKRLRESIAPSIWGYNEIKEALVLQMFGGVRKISSDGNISRGDMHIFLIGDPSCAKSQILQYVSNIAPKGRYIVGMGATGAGITATVVKDEFLNGWALEAGAIVLANKGILTIDEIDKMKPEDRSAMHQALEQQVIDISKANVQARLTCQTSVLAAGNPKLGRFEPSQPINQQIDLPPALLNRFDLIFVLRDVPDEKQDDAIAQHILGVQKDGKTFAPVSRDLFRKYISYAKRNCKPVLTEEANNKIKEYYITIRKASGGEKRTISIAARQLQGLIRLAEAHAKSRLSKTVDEQDAEVAIRLTTYYMIQVGYDPETNTIDIDRFTTSISSTKRNKVFVLKEVIKDMEEICGKQIPLDELRIKVGSNMNDQDFEESIEQLRKTGDIFCPKSGLVQIM